MIHILDEIIIAPDDEHKILKLLDERYLPGLAARPALKLLNRWISPPVVIPGKPNTLWLLWQVSDAYGYYGMRGTAGAEVPEFWSAVDALCQHRRRHVMNDAGQLLPRPLEVA